MINNYFNIKDTLFDITEKYPETIDLFVSIGFENIKDEKQRQLIGKAISLETALNMKRINVKTFKDSLIEVISDNRNSADDLLGEISKIHNADVKIEGILPCPVRIPLMEEFTKWMEENGANLGISIDYELKAASMGVDWLKDSLEKADSPDVLSDVFISAGFDLFFDKHLIGKFKEKGVFEDITGIEHYNKDFDNEEKELLKYKISHLVSANRLKLYIRIDLINNESTVDYEDIMNYIKEQGVVYGIDEKGIITYCNKMEFSKELVAATGLDPVDGKDAELMYDFDTSSENKFKEKEDGTIDFQNLNNVVNVIRQQIRGRSI